MLPTTDPAAGGDESQTIYFQPPFQTGTPYISPILFPSKISHQAFFYVSGPIFNVAGNVVGVLRMQMSIAFLEDFIAGSSGLAGPDQAVSVALNQANWRVVVAHPRDTFFKPIGKQIHSTLWLVCIISIVAIAVAIGVASQLTRPILDMTTIARQIATGDLTVQVPIPGHD